jgi:hypothetical protein
VPEQHTLQVLNSIHAAPSRLARRLATGSTCSTGSTTGSGQHASQFRSQAYSSIKIGPVLCIYTDNAS